MQLRWQRYTFTHDRTMAKFAVPLVGLHTLVYCNAPNPDLVFKCQSDKSLWIYLHEVHA